MSPRAAPRLSALLAGLLLAGVARAAPDEPLRLASGGTFGRLFLEVTGADARAPAPGVDVRWTLANDWSAPTTVTRGSRRVTFQTDAQSDALVIEVRSPWSRALGAGPRLWGRPLFTRLSTAVELRVVEHWGGGTDGVIEGWHTLIRSDEFQRPLHPRDVVRVSLREPATDEGFEVRSPRLTVGDATLRTQVLLAEGEASGAEPARWGLSARLDVKVPLGRPERLGGSGGWDAGAALLGTVALTPWATLHALAAASAFSPLAVPTALQPRTWHFTGELSLALRRWGWTVLVEDRVTSPLFEGGWELPPRQDPEAGYYGLFLPRNQVSLGLRRGRWTLFGSEDWTPGAPSLGGSADWFYDSNAPDLAVGLAYRFP